MSAMAKTETDDDGTIENRVYLFESLAKAFVEKSADDLSAKSPERRARALRALADLAYVSCAVADTQHLSPKAVRRKVLAATALVSPEAPSSADGDDEA
jgi:predicted nuclease of restriction endonuclease-like RecB superfamily